MSEINFLERSFSAKNSPKGGEGIWQSPEGLAYDAVGNEVDIGDTVKILSKHRMGQVFVVEKIEGKYDDPSNVRLWHHGWMNSTEILKIGESE